MSNKTKLKIKWRVEQKTTGLMSIGRIRGWPIAEYQDGSSMAFITCEDPYYSDNVKTGNHKELKLHVCDYSQTPWERKTLVKRFATLHDAKQGLIDFMQLHTEFQKKL